MEIERIILGDDHLEFARQEMPPIPNAEIVYVATPASLIDRVASADLPFTIIVSDYDYGEDHPNGIQLYETLRDRNLAQDARKVLWTGNADEPEIRRQAKELGLEVLDKDELPAIVGMAVSKTPLKKDGTVLVYTHHKPGSSMYESINSLIIECLKPGLVKIGHELKPELQSGQYGLVLDTTTLDREKGVGIVAHDMKYIQMPEVPRVVTLRHTSTILADMANAVIKFYGIE